MNPYLRGSILLALLQIVLFPVARTYGLYNRFWFTDAILHILAGVMITAFWLWMVRKETLSNLNILISAVAVATLGSFLWEFWEFGGWKLIPGNLPNYIPTLSDTLSDITFGAVGAIILVLARLYSRRN